MHIQEFIHKYSEGAGSRLVKLALVFFVMVGLAVWYDAAAFKNLSTIEGMDAAQVARNIGEGRGFTTDFVRPFSLHLLKQHGATNEGVLKDNHPDLAQAPLYPALLAVALKAMPFKMPDLEKVKNFSVYAPDLWIAGFNQLLFLIAVWQLWRLGRRLFDEPVAWVSAGVFAGADLFWRFSVSGQSTMLLVVLLLALVDVLARLEPQTREGASWSEGKLLLAAALVGLLTGLLGLTRYSFAWLIIPVGFFLAALVTPRRVAMVAAAAAAFLAVMSPWVARNMAVSGTLFGTAGYALVQETPFYPGLELERTLNPDFTTVEGGQIWTKTLAGAREILEKELPRLGGSWVTAFFLVSLMMPFRNPTLQKLRWFIVGSLVLMIVVQAAGRTGLSKESPEVNTENHLVALAPLLFLFGTSLFFVLLDQFGAQAVAFRTFAMGLLVMVAAAPLMFSLLMPVRTALVYPPYYPPLIQEKANWLQKNDALMADFPWATAWYGHRQSVWLSLKHREDASLKRRNDFYAFTELGKPIRALYLSARTLKTIETRTLESWVQREGREEWEPFVQDWETFALVGVYLFREVPTGFPLRQAPFGPLPELFLTESERSAVK